MCNVWHNSFNRQIQTGNLNVYHHPFLSLSVYSFLPLFLSDSGVFLEGDELELIKEFKYLGVTLHSTLSFKGHENKISKTMTLNFSNFNPIRSSLTTEAAKEFLHARISSHIENGFTNWSFIITSTTTTSTLNQVESFYKRALLFVLILIKQRNKNPAPDHHCHILQKYGIFSLTIS